MPDRAEACSGLEEDGIGWEEGRMVSADEITSLLKGVKGAVGNGEEESGHYGEENWGKN